MIPFWGKGPLRPSEWTPTPCWHFREQPQRDSLVQFWWGLIGTGSREASPGDSVGKGMETRLARARRTGSTSRMDCSSQPFLWEPRATVMIMAGERLGAFTAVASQMSAVEHEEDEQCRERGKLFRATSAAEVAPSPQKPLKKRKTVLLGLLSRSWQLGESEFL